MLLPAQLLRRNKTSHKNDFGHVLVVAGSPAMLGAAALAGLSAMRSGAGLTTIAVARSLNLTLQRKISNVIMTLPLPETRQGTISGKAFDLLRKQWDRYSVVAIGPGMTVNPQTARFITKMYDACPLPMIVDADALNALSKRGGAPSLPLPTRILTPHPGEMARLTGLSKGEIERDRTGVAARYAKAWQATVVLKGHHTVVASSDGKTYLNTTGNPGMATAGTGDVLTGILAAFLAQGLDSFEAARAAVYLHGRAGDCAVKTASLAGLVATDLIDRLPVLLKA